MATKHLSLIAVKGGMQMLYGLLLGDAAISSHLPRNVRTKAKFKDGAGTLKITDRFFRLAEIPMGIDATGNVLTASGGAKKLVVGGRLGGDSFFAAAKLPATA